MKNMSTVDLLLHRPAACVMYAKETALTLTFSASSHRILLFMNGCQDSSETKSFLHTQVRFSRRERARTSAGGTRDAPLATSRGEVSYRWCCSTNMCSISKSITLFVLNEQPQLKKVQEQQPDDPRILFTLTFWMKLELFVFLSCVTLCFYRLPAVCWSRDLSWVSSCRHEIWCHYGSAWCLHEVRTHNIQRADSGGNIFSSIVDSAFSCQKPNLSLSKDHQLWWKHITSTAALSQLLETARTYTQSSPMVKKEFYPLLKM